MKKLNTPDAESPTLDEELTGKIIAAAQQAGICNREIEHYTDTSNQEEENENGEKT
jgi:hypothetical protein